MCTFKRAGYFPEPLNKDTMWRRTAWEKRSGAHGGKFFDYFRTFFVMYKPEYFYWEFIMLLRKVAVVFIVTFNPHPRPRFFWLSLLFLASLWLQVKCMPYTDVTNANDDEKKGPKFPEGKLAFKLIKYQNMFELFAITTLLLLCQISLLPTRTYNSSSFWLILQQVMMWSVAFILLFPVAVIMLQSQVLFRISVRKRKRLSRLSLDNDALLKDVSDPAAPTDPSEETTESPGARARLLKTLDSSGCVGVEGASDSPESFGKLSQMSGRGENGQEKSRKSRRSTSAKPETSDRNVSAIVSCSNSPVHRALASDFDSLSVSLSEELMEPDDVDDVPHQLPHLAVQHNEEDTLDSALLRSDMVGVADMDLNHLTEQHTISIDHDINLLTLSNPAEEFAEISHASQFANVEEEMMKNNFFQYGYDNVAVLSGNSSEDSAMLGMSGNVSIASADPAEELQADSDASSDDDGVRFAY